MRSHTIVHRGTTKFFDDPFAFKNDIEKEGLPRGSTPGLGAGGPRFKSGRPDQNILRIFFRLSKPSAPQLPCGILPGRRSEFASRLIPKTWLHAVLCKRRVGRSAI